jgi:hypothetical protein
MNSRTLFTAICIAAAGSAFAGGGGMSKDAFKAMKDRIDATQDTELKACDKSQGNAKDICRAEAKGRARVALADLKAEYQPSPETDRGKMMALADAEYDVAKQKCDAMSGNSKDVCVKEAKATHTRAKADAKVARASNEQIARTSDKAADTRRDAREDVREAQYKVAKETCDALSGDAKARYGKS